MNFPKDSARYKECSVRSMDHTQDHNVNNASVNMEPLLLSLGAPWSQSGSQTVRHYNLQWCEICLRLGVYARGTLFLRCKSGSYEVRSNERRVPVHTTSRSDPSVCRSSLLDRFEQIGGLVGHGIVSLLQYQVENRSCGYRAGRRKRSVACGCSERPSFSASWQDD